MISNLMAILLRRSPPRWASPAGATSRRPAATATRDRATILLWILAKIATLPPAISQSAGSRDRPQHPAFGLPLIWERLPPALDVLVVLFLQHRLPLDQALVISLILPDRRIDSPSEIWLAPGFRRAGPRLSFRCTGI
jgi:hypothetical protein